MGGYAGTVVSYGAEHAAKALGWGVAIGDFLFGSGVRQAHSAGPEMEDEYLRRMPEESGFSGGGFGGGEGGSWGEPPGQVK